MAYVSIPKDLDQVKNKVAFGLTLRQIICFGAGASVGVPVYFMTRNAIGTTNASLCMMVILLPAFMMAIFEKDGLPLEQVLMNYIRNRYLKPEVRMYRRKTNRPKKRRATDKKKAQNSNRIPGSYIPKDSQIKGTLIRDPFADDEKSDTNPVSISFTKEKAARNSETTCQPISDEIILQEINKSIGYWNCPLPAVGDRSSGSLEDHALHEEPSYEHGSEPVLRYQYRGMPSFLANPTVMSFEEMAGFEEDDAGYDCNLQMTSSDPRGMLPVEDYLDRLLNSVG